LQNLGILYISFPVCIFTTHTSVSPALLFRSTLHIYVYGPKAPESSGHLLLHFHM